MFAEKSSATQAEKQSFRSPELNMYLDRLSGTKKWWTKKNSTSYYDIINTLKLIRGLEITDDDENREVLVEVYNDLYKQCNEYLEGHKSFRWTAVGRERFRIISEIKRIAKENKPTIAPYFTTNGTQHEINNIESRNKQWQQGGRQIWGMEGFGMDIKRLAGATNDNGSEAGDKVHGKDMELESKNVHIGNRVKIDGLHINRIRNNGAMRGFHESGNEETDTQNVKQMYENLLAGNEGWQESGFDNSEVAYEDLSENEKKNIAGIRQYKHILFNHLKHLYKKYGKFLTQMHPFDIYLRSNDLALDVQFAQDTDQMFGVDRTGMFATLEDTVAAFNENIQKNPVLKYVFTEDTADEDYFVLVANWYYGIVMNKLLSIPPMMIAEEGNKRPDFSKEGYYCSNQSIMISKSDIAKEKKVEEVAQKMGLGKMKGFTANQKKLYLSELRSRGWDKEFAIDERLEDQDK